MFRLTSFIKYSNNNNFSFFYRSMVGNRSVFNSLIIKKNPTFQRFFSSENQQEDNQDEDNTQEHDKYHIYRLVGASITLASTVSLVYYHRSKISFGLHYFSNFTFAPKFFNAANFISDLSNPDIDVNSNNFIFFNWHERLESIIDALQKNPKTLIKQLNVLNLLASDSNNERRYAAAYIIKTFVSPTNNNLSELLYEVKRGKKIDKFNNILDILLKLVTDVDADVSYMALQALNNLIVNTSVSKHCSYANLRSSSVFKTLYRCIRASNSKVREGANDVLVSYLYYAAPDTPYSTNNKTNKPLDLLFEYKLNLNISILMNALRSATYKYQIDNNAKGLIRVFTVMVSLDPNNSSLREELAHAYMLDGRFDDSNTELRKILEIKPSNEVMDLLIRNLAVSKKKQDKAELLEILKIQFSNGILQKQQNPSREILLSSLLLEFDSPHEAIEVIQSVLSRNPVHSIPSALVLLTNCLVSGKLFHEAGDTISKYLKFVPEDPQAHFLHSFILFKLQQYDDALLECQNVLSRIPKHENAHKLLAKIFVKQQRWDEAKYKYSELIKQYPNDQDIYYQTGLLYESLNKIDQAFKYYASAIDIWNRLSEKDGREHYFELHSADKIALDDIQKRYINNAELFRTTKSFKIMLEKFNKLMNNK